MNTPVKDGINSSKSKPKNGVDLSHLLVRRPNNHTGRSNASPRSNTNLRPSNNPVVRSGNITNNPMMMLKRHNHVGFWFETLITPEGLYANIGETQINEKFIVYFNMPMKDYLEYNPHYKPAKENCKEKRFYAAFDSYIYFLNMLNKIPSDKWFFFEIIPAYKTQKLYFDIDVHPEKLSGSPIDEFCNELLSVLVDTIINIFNSYNCKLDVTENILIFSSNSSIKYSYHVIVDGYALSSCYENKMLALKILEQYPDKFKQFVDILYAPNQALRLFQCQKPGSGRPKILVDKWLYHSVPVHYKYKTNIHLTKEYQQAYSFSHLYAASCITVTNYCKIIPISEECMGYYPKKTTIHDDSEIEENMLSLIVKVLNQFHPFYTSTYEVRESSANYIKLIRKVAAKCEICNRVHESDHGYLSLHPNGALYFVCWRDKRNNPTSYTRKYITNMSELYPEIFGVTSNGENNCSPKLESSSNISSLSKSDPIAPPKSKSLENRRREDSDLESESEDKDVGEALDHLTLSQKLIYTKNPNFNIVKPEIDTHTNPVKIIPNKLVNSYHKESILKLLNNQNSSCVSQNTHVDNKFITPENNVTIITTPTLSKCADIISKGSDTNLSTSVNYIDNSYPNKINSSTASKSHANPNPTNAYNFGSHIRGIPMHALVRSVGLGRKL